MTTQNPAAPQQPRRLHARIGTNGNYVFATTLTPASRTDVVDFIVKPVRSLPIIFVPGIMGSNLRARNDPTVMAWRFDSSAQIAKDFLSLNPGQRQNLLHPARTEVDPGGAVPEQPIGVLSKPAHFRQRGWGEVAAESYQGILVWLEQHFNSQRSTGCNDPSHNCHSQLNKTLCGVLEGLPWGYQKRPFEPLTRQEAELSENWSYPVYAFGYNWLDDAGEAAKLLAKRIDAVIAANNGDAGECEQVILITHSMGGLVARACAELPDVQQKIAGVVHGVMPALGAPVAYRRCKVGLFDEDMAASLVIGRTGQHVTAVFAQSPGALQLLPNTRYAREWMQMGHLDGSIFPAMGLHGFSNPYTSVYVERNRWWGLVKEEWLSPEDGISIEWETYLKVLKSAAEFHATLDIHYHPNTWSFYGWGVPSYAKVTWALDNSVANGSYTAEAPTIDQLFDTDRNKMVGAGSNPQYLPGAQVQRFPGVNESIRPKPLTLLYAVRACKPGPNETGDGTVPEQSARDVVPYSRQVFAITGLKHEPAYKSARAREITAYFIAKIACAAREPGGAIPLRQPPTRWKSA